MLANYFKIIIRTFLKNRIYTLINISGLTSGMTVFILIMVYVNYEFSFDQYHEKKDRIFRIVKQDKDNFYQGDNRFAVTPAPLAPTIMEEFPEVESATRFLSRGNVLMGVGEESFLESIHATDHETFDIFTFEYLSGNPELFLKEKYSAIITQSIARKYWGDQDPIGKTIRYRDEHEFTIGGIIKDMPKNSHFTMDIILDYVTVMEVDNRQIDRWNNSSFFTYFLLAENSDADALEAKFPALRDKYTEDKLDEDGQDTRFYFQEFAKIHLHSNILFDIAPPTDAKKLYIYSTIALLILLIACINYMNLATAHATKRAKEVGIRKVVGAFKHNLMLQFLGESLLLTFVALIISVTIIWMILPIFSQFVDRELTINFVQNPQLIIILLTTSILVGIISGSYPAFALSNYKPIRVLKGNFKKGAEGAKLRNILVIIQFAISGILIIGTLIVSEQLNFIQNKEMGYNRDQIVILRIRDRDFRKKLPVFKEELRKIPGVLNVASSTSLPNNISSSNHARWPGKPEDVEIIIYTASADFNFVDLYGLEIAEGRNFSKEFGDDNGAILINESAAKALGWEDPIGRELITWSNDTSKIVGILKDFHQHSLHLEIMPLQLFYNDIQIYVSVKIADDDMQNTIASIQDTKESFSIKFPFDYSFFDEVFDKAYISEQKTGKLVNWFTGLTILISCLGLYGLASYTAEQRIKEVGIRKVLGASITKIVVLLSKNFTVLVLISFLVSAPIAYFLMMNWLEDFAYHIELSMVTFLGTLVIMIFVAWGTVGYRTFKAANANPVNSLKDE